MNELDDELSGGLYSDDVGTTVPEPINISKHLARSETVRLQKLCQGLQKLVAEVLESQAQGNLFAVIRALGRSNSFSEGWVSLSYEAWLKATGLRDWQFTESLDALKERRLITQRQNEGSDTITLQADKEGLDRLLDKLYPGS